MDTTTIKTLLNVADDTGIETAIEALQAENTRLAGIVNQVEADKAAQVEAEIETFVTDAVTAGKITNDVKDKYIALAKTDFEAVKTVIEAAKPAPLKNLIHEETAPPEMTADEARQLWNEKKVKNQLGRWFEESPEEYSKINKLRKG